MRVGGEPTAAHFLTEEIQLLLFQASFEEGPGIDAGNRMTLEVDVVAAPRCVRAPKEVVEADFVERR
jgi:hypothetical protein